MNSELTQFSALLNVLWRGGAYGYLWTKAGDEKTTQWFAPGEPLPPFSKSEDVYFGVHPVGASKKRLSTNRALEGDIVALNCLYGDFDSKDNPDMASVISKLSHAPSVIINSGGGFHLYWLFKEPVKVSKTHLDRFKHALEGWQLLIGSDPNAKDLPRVLRVPGSYNQKYTPQRLVTFEKFDLSLAYDGKELLKEATRHYENIQTSLALAHPKPAVQLKAAVNSKAVEAYVDTILKDVDLLAVAPSGGRTNLLFKTACRLGNVVGAGLLSYTDAEALLMSAAVANGLVKEDGERSIRQQINNGLTDGQASPLDTAKFQEFRATGAALTFAVEPVDMPAPEESPAQEAKPVYSSIPTEQAILGLILAKPHLFLDIRDKHGVHGDIFHNPRHQVIWSAMDFESIRGLPDETTVKERLKLSGWLSKIGGAMYLSELKELAALEESLGNYTAILKDTHARRNLKVVARTLETLSLQADTDAATALNMANSALNAISKPQGEQTTDALKDGASELYLQLAASLNGVAYGSSTGYRELDRITRFLPEKTVIVMGRPGSGKTALMLNMAWRQVKAGLKVGFVSLEMGREEINARLAALEKCIPYKHILYRDLKNAQELRLFMDYMQEMPSNFYLNDRKGQTMPEILAWARNIATLHGLDALYVDYLGRVHFPNSAADMRRVQFGDATLALCNFAAEYKLAAVLGSQVNRQVDSRADKAPLETDIAESDLVAHHVDQIWAIYRDAMYNPESSPNSMQVFIRKNRQGELAPANLFCDLSIQRITDIGE